jgi:hypothetical protein
MVARPEFRSMSSLPVNESVYRIGTRLFLVAVEEDATRSMFNAKVFHLEPATRAVVVTANGIPLHSTGPTTWQAAARVVQQLETYLGEIAREQYGYDVAAHRGVATGGVWTLPG